MDLKKVSAILEQQPPRDIHEVQWFLGFVNFYRRFIKGFFKQLAQITALHKKGMHFSWTPEA